MIQEYSETMFSKLSDDFQEKLYMIFQQASPRDKILLFTKFKYGDEITFKELTEKMHVSTSRFIYTKYMDMVSGVFSD